MSAAVQGVGPPNISPMSPGVHIESSGSLPMMNIGTSNSSRVDGMPIEEKLNLIASAVFFSSIVPESLPSQSGCPRSTSD